MTTESPPAKVRLSDELGMVQKRSDFADACVMLPEGAYWGDPLTPTLAREIVDAAVAATHADYSDGVRLMAAEIERLRSALRLIADDVCDNSYTRTARAALGPNV